jgi:hypothetical protein
MALFRFGNHADFADYEIRNVLAEKVNGLPTPIAAENGRFVYNTANNRFYVLQNGVWGLTASNSDALAGATLAQVRDFAQTTGQRPSTAISDFDTATNNRSVSVFQAPTADFGMNTKKIINLLAGTSANDAVNKAQLDAVAAIANASAVGIAIKAPVRAASTTNLTLSGTQTVDGVALVAGDRVLAAGQTTGSANGIYVVASGAWTRATDADENTELAGGTLVVVTAGTANGDSLWGIISDGAITIGTTATTWARIIAGSSGTFSIAGAGLTATGSTVAVQPGNGIIADGSSTRVDPAVVVRKFSTTLGAGTNTAVVTHNLNTEDIQVQVRDVATKDLVFVGATVTGVNTLSIEFGAAVSANQYRVTVFA